MVIGLVSIFISLLSLHGVYEITATKSLQCALNLKGVHVAWNRNSNQISTRLWFKASLTPCGSSGLKGRLYRMCKMEKMAWLVL
jgi:hypothetical protein